MRSQVGARDMDTAELLLGRELLRSTILTLRSGREARLSGRRCTVGRLTVGLSLRGVRLTRRRVLLRVALLRWILLLVLLKWILLLLTVAWRLEPSTRGSLGVG